MWTGDNNWNLLWSSPRRVHLHLFGEQMVICMKHIGKWHTLYSEQNISKLLGSVLPISLFLVNLRPLYQLPWDNSNDTKHDCKYHLHSCRTLYYAIDHSEWAGRREMGERKWVERIGEKGLFPHLLSVRCGNRCPYVNALVCRLCPSQKIKVSEVL